MNFAKLFTGLISLLIISATACSSTSSDEPAPLPAHQGGTSPEAREPGTIRIASYNLHACSPSGSYEANYPNVIKALKVIDADFVALQELDSCNTRHAEYQAKVLGEGTGMNYIYAKTIDYKGGAYGIGMLSRKKPISVDVVRLPGQEPRAAIVAEFDSLIYIGTHMCVVDPQNQVQSFNILNAYAENNLAKKGKPIFLGGDLNSTSLPSVSVGHWGTISTERGTFWSSGRRIDYVLEYLRGAKKCTVVKADIPSFSAIDFTTVSDHLPIFVDVRLPK